MSHRLEVRLYRRLPGFTLDVEWTGGEGVAALFGPSGAGKTLTLQCLAGLLRPDAGRIVIDGRVLFDSEAGTDLPPQRRRVGYVFQGYALFPHLSVADNIGFGLRDRPRAEARRRTTEVIARMGLEGLEGRSPRDISGGQRQRVALGRALAPDPALLLLDEPLSALDAPLRSSLRDELRQIPASERVAGIVGIRNVLHGTVLKATADRIQFRWREQLLEAVNSPTRSYLPAPESSLAFFIRPEYVRLIRKDRGTPDPGHHMNLMAGRVVGEADFGTTWTLYFKLDAPGGPAQGDYDLEIEVPRLVYEILEISRDRHWQLSIHRGSIHVLPSA